jgi:hypothetical protein
MPFKVKFAMPLNNMACKRKSDTDIWLQISFNQYVDGGDWSGSRSTRYIPYEIPRYPLKRKFPGPAAP